MPTGEPPPVTLRFRDATPEDIPRIRVLADRIWWACYRGMIPDAQIEYMLERMYAPARIASEMAGAVRWELVEAGESEGARGGSEPAVPGPLLRRGEEGEPEQPTKPGCVPTRPAPIGFLAWEFDEAASVVQLHKLYLDPAFHGRGGGQAMLRHVREAATARGAREIRLRVNRGNHRAIAAYRRAGYEILEDRCVDIGNGFVMDDHILILRPA